MPPIYAMDDTIECMAKPDSTFCIASFTLFSKYHSDLMHFIQKYSAQTIKHFNHSNVHRGICITTTCKEYLKENTTWDPEVVLERCFNASIWNDYSIEAKLSELKFCKRGNEKSELDISDYVVAAIYIFLIILNVVGSFYENAYRHKNQKRVNRYLLAFSIRRNWAQLVASANDGPDQRLRRLKSFYGFKAITMFLIVTAHTLVVAYALFVKDTMFMEKVYNYFHSYLFLNGSMLTPIFFLMSSFLLTYNLQVLSETQAIGWTRIPKMILLRWIRLTPVYGLVIATVATWLRHSNDEPFWQFEANKEANSCRQYWWANILYMNNYIFSKDRCLGQTWYLAADSQLFCFGVILLVLIQKPIYRKVALSILFPISLVIVAVNTYVNNLDAITIQTPQTMKESYIDNDTFNLDYVAGHTNLTTYILGIAGALLVYQWQKEGKNLSEYKKYRLVFHLLILVVCAVILSGSVFYIDGYTPSIFVRMTYAAFHRPIIHFVMLIYIIGCIFKYESLYRRIMEWRGFTWLGRVTYSTFLIHSIVTRIFAASITEPIYINPPFHILCVCGCVFISFLCGTLVYLFVEAPVLGLSKILVKK